MSPPAAPPPTGNHRWMHRLVAAFVALVVLATLLVLGIQVLLATDLPRRRVLAALEQATGLTVEAKGLTTSWGGRSVFRDVLFRLPLDQSPLATAATVEANHTDLVRVIIGGRFRLRELRIESAVVEIYEDDRARWSLPRAIQAIGRARPDQDTGGNAANLPRITLVSSTLRITRPGRQPVSLPLEFDGLPESTLTWRFDGSVGASAVRGRLTPASWAHEADVSLEGLTPVLALWMDEPPEPARAKVHWAGEAAASGLAGKLTVERLEITDASALGDTTVRIAGERLIVNPGTIHIASPRLPGPLQISRGTIDAGLKMVTAHHLRAEVPGLVTELAGRWDVDADAVSTTFAWSGATGGEAIKHHGSGELSAKLPQVGRREITLKLDADGEAGAQHWSATTTATAAGISWNALDGRIDMPRLVVPAGEEPLDLSGFSLSFSSRWPVVTLTALAVPGATITRSDATIDVLTKEWQAALDADAWTIRQLGSQPVAVSLRSSGDARQLDFSRLRVASPQVELLATGSFVPGRPEPLEVHADLTAELLALPSKRSEAAFEQKDEEERGQEHLVQHAGLIRATMDVAGHVTPTRLTGRGVVQAEGVRVGKGVLQPIQVQVRATADPQGARLETDTFPLLNGQWKLAARYVKERNEAAAHLECKQVALDAVTRLVEPRIVVGGDLGADVNIRLPELDAKRFQIDGAWDVGGLRAAGHTFDRGRGRIGLQRGRIRLSDIAVSRGDAQLTGQVEFAAANPRHVALDLATHRWPIAVAGTGLSIMVDSHAQLEVDTLEWAADGPVSINADASLYDKPLGSITATTRLKGRTIDAERITASILGGTISGHAVVPLDKWTTSTADLQAEKIDLETLGDLAKAMGDLRGVISGRIAAAPTSDKRALEPLRFEAALKIENGAHRGMQFGDVRLVGYAGGDRIMLDRSEIDIAGGTVAFWSRLTWHGDQPFVHASLETQSLDLDQLVRAVDPTIGETPGRVSGRAAFGGYVYHPRRTYGHAQFVLRDADLGRFPVAAQLYGLLNLNFAKRDPTGRAIARLRLEGDVVQLERLQYYHRGADIVANGKVENIWLGADSPVHFIAAGALRPLKGSNLPFGRELDRLLRAVFVHAASVEATGTVRDRHVKVIPFAEVSQTFNRLLGTTVEE